VPKAREEVVPKARSEVVPKARAQTARQPTRVSGVCGNNAMYLGPSCNSVMRVQQ
jgi:hypothetical protein